MTRAAASSAPLVVVIDDEQDITTFLSLALEDDGYRVRTTNDPQGAIELLERERPDLICLDLLMPEHTGVSLWAEIQRHPSLSSVPTVILSGLALRAELPRILERAGGLPEPAAYIEKPVEIAQFLAMVHELVGRPERVSP